MNVVFQTEKEQLCYFAINFAKCVSHTLRVHASLAMDSIHAGMAEASRPVTLNVGGTLFTTTVATLTQGLCMACAIRRVSLN